MSNRRFNKLILVIFLLSAFIPSYTYEASATLILEEHTPPDVQKTWGSLSLLYNNLFHNISILQDEIDAFDQAASDLIDVEVIGSSYHGQDIKSVRITNELRTRQKAKTLVVSHHHGNEQISVEVALRFIRDMLNNYGDDDVITKAIDSQEIYVIPTINPDALDRVVNENDYILRKNVRPFDDDGDGSIDEDPYEDIDGDGIVSIFTVYEKHNGTPVRLYYYYEGYDNDGDGLTNEDLIGHIDLNRNYDSFFRDGGSWGDDSLARNYPGISPFSEPETQAFRDFALQHRFAMAYSLHSGANATFFMKNSIRFVEPDLCEAMIFDLGSMLPSSFFFNDYFYGDPNEDPIYVAGGWDNWMYFIRKTLMPISLELYTSGPAQDPANEVPIIDNATHLVTEWKETVRAANPEAHKIERLWEDVQPYFPYLLENTPRMTVDATLNTRNDSPGSRVNITFICTNLSPRLHSVSTVDLFDDTGTKIADGEVILANSTTQMSMKFPLPSTFTNTYEIRLGNEYVGYYRFILRKPELASSIPSPISFPILGVLIALIGTCFYIVKSRRRHNNLISSG